jgi:hypothetical protein
MKTSTTAQLMIAEVISSDDKVRWFSDNGCVIHGDDQAEVFISGTLIGTFSRRDVGVRNLLLVGLAKDRKVRKGKLAVAFGLDAERLRRICRLVEKEGINAIPRHPRGGRQPLVTPRVRLKIEQLFVVGLSASEAYARYGKRAGLTPRTVRSIREQWGTKASATTAPRQMKLGLAEGEAQEASAVAAEVLLLEGDDRESTTWPENGIHLQSSSLVRHVGSWLLIALVHALGLHTAVISRWQTSQRWRERLRVALDAVIIALGLRQRCVEGVRVLQSPSGPTLLRIKSVPSAGWTRRVLHRYVGESNATWAHWAMIQQYLERSRSEEKSAAVFYVDNHLRPYTGKQTIRKGWRMQDKQVKPGVTDYYVHDEDGRPVWRFDAPSHDSLTSWLLPVTTMLRTVLGQEQRIMVAFDRAGAFPEQLASLRDRGLEFVTYERRPYALLSPSAFTEKVEVNGETIGVCENHQKNLGRGRGRVRRIALLMPNEHQVNLLAVSQEPVWRLIEVMQGRWVQENGFKHGNERWGINHLDGRTVNPYPPQTVIPNPARRRLDYALRLARQREGEARRHLARLSKDDRRRQKVEQDLASALADQAQLETQRPHVPKHAALEETDLRDKLVYHGGELKTLLDTVRIACANAESELATWLAPHLRKPAEAKKVLANVFASPGAVQVNGKTIVVTLSPAGTRNEKEAVDAMLQTVNRANLTLPGDPEKRQLCFRSHFP